MKRLILIDNYDSFTFNLYHQIEKIFDGDIDVLRNDEVEIKNIKSYDIIVLSPGPKLPKDAGKMMEIIDVYFREKPIVGICLGMQGLAEYFGSPLIKLEHPEHGQSKLMKLLRSHSMFKDCPNEFNVGRYHSWGIKLEQLNKHLIPISIDEQQCVMSFQHSKYKIFGLQFHPESILTEYGDKIMENLLKICL